MSNKRDLRAFVRFDGSGRIVAGSLILRKNKPKVGKWHEIQAYECCNYIPTTSTTTTQGGGGTTPTAWVAYTSFNATWSCQQINGLTTILYTSVSTLTTGVQLYTDAALTEPYNYFSGTFVAINGVVWEITSVNGPIENPQPCSSLTTTTTTTQAGIFAVLSNSSCGSGTAIQVQFTTGESLCDAPLAISGDFSSAPEEFYIVYNGISKLFVKTSPTTAQGAGGAPGECVVCG
jgi:hypothetical protein